MHIKKSEEGFVLVLSLLLLVTMTTIGAGLVFTASKQASQSNHWSNYQQTFYAVETGMEDVRSWLEERVYKEGEIPYKGNDVKKLCSSIFDKTQINYVVTRNNLQGFSDYNDLHDIDSTIKENSYTYEYYIEEVEGAMQVNKGEGWNVLGSNDYEKESSTTKKTYKTYVCAKGPDNEKSNLEVLLSIILGSS